MFDFDVVTGPANPTRSAKPPAAKPMTSPAPAAAAAAIRDNSCEAERSVADPAGSRR